MVGIAHTPRTASQPASWPRGGMACQESAQANGQIVNVKSSAELTCQTDYISCAPGLLLADGRTDSLAGMWHVLWHRVAFRFHCQLTLLQLHSAMATATATILAASRPIRHSGQIASASLFYGLVAVAAAYCFRFASMWQPRSARLALCLLAPCSACCKLKLCCNFAAIYVSAEECAGIGTGPAALPLINCQRKLIST